MSGRVSLIHVCSKMRLSPCFYTIENCNISAAYAYRDTTTVNPSHILKEISNSPRLLNGNPLSKHISSSSIQVGNSNDKSL